MCPARLTFGEASGAVFRPAWKLRKSAIAQLENARLSYQAELAQDYFELRGTDGENDLLETTVKSYQDYLKLTQDSFREWGGVGRGRGAGADPTGHRAGPGNRLRRGARAVRARHCCADGKGPRGASVSYHPLSRLLPPPVPVGVPSALLERRPISPRPSVKWPRPTNRLVLPKLPITRIGLSISGAVGFEGHPFLKWFSWPDRFWCVGARIVGDGL